MTLPWRSVRSSAIAVATVSSVGSREIPGCGDSGDTLAAITMLSTHDRLILDFERGWWRYPGPKESTIPDLLGIDAAAYYRRLRELLEAREADEYDPLTVRRLRRLMSMGVS